MSSGVAMRTPSMNCGNTFGARATATFGFGGGAGRERGGGGGTGAGGGSTSGGGAAVCAPPPGTSSTSSAPPEPSRSMLVALSTQLWARRNSHRWMSADSAQESTRRSRSTARVSETDRVYPNPRVYRRSVRLNPADGGRMNLQPSEKAQQYLGKLRRLMDEHIYPNEEEMRRQHEALPDRWQVPPLPDDLKKKARAAGLWNLFLPESKHGAGLTNLEYAFLCEEMGKVFFASEVFNCSAPDTGNMEVIERYGNAEQQKEWLAPPPAR